MSFGISAATAFAAVGAGAAVYGAVNASNAAGAQTSALEAGQQTQATSLADQLQLQQQALAQQQSQYTTNVAMEQPYMDAGAGALSEYDQLLGIQPVSAAGTPGTLPTTTPAAAATGATGTGTGATPTTTAPTIAMDPTTGLPATTAGSSQTLAQQQMGALSQTPGYQFQLQQGEQAIANSASATTGDLSTAELNAQDQYAQGLAGTTYNSFMDRLNGVNTEGQQAASQTVAAGQDNSNAQAAIVQGETNATANTGNNVAQLQAGVGAAQASGYNGASSAISGGASNLLLGSLLQNNNPAASPGALTPAELAVQPPAG